MLLADRPLRPLADDARGKLLRLAYRMLGSQCEAEDALQDAQVRVLESDPGAVRCLESYVRTVLVRICLDRLKSARWRREVCVGAWLPEPLVDPEPIVGDDITLPLMLALERLSPLERAAFLLHDIFGLPFQDVAATLGRDGQACRKLASRARRNVRRDRPRFETEPRARQEIAAAFLAASREGDLDRLRALLAKDVAVHVDGRGIIAPVGVVRGLEDVIALHRRLARLFARCRSQLLGFVTIDGLAGFVTLEQRQTLQATALQIEGRRVTALYVTRNPEKLRRLSPGFAAQPQG